MKRQCEYNITQYFSQSARTCLLQTHTRCLMTEFMKLGEKSGLLFALPFLGHWESWMLDWAWAVLNEGSPHHHSHVRADVCSCMCVCVCSEAKHLHPKPKRHTHTLAHKSLPDTHSTCQLSGLTALMPTHTHIHTHRRKIVFLYLPSLSTSELWAAALLKHWGRDLFHFKRLFSSLLHQGWVWTAGQHIRDGLVRERAWWRVTERATVKWNVNICQHCISSLIHGKHTWAY